MADLAIMLQKQMRMIRTAIDDLSSIRDGMAEAERERLDRVVRKLEEALQTDERELAPRLLSRDAGENRRQ